ncbi:MAG: nickel pincer cofactor biosynthesis protein LarC [Deltaproteobacteria bacterium]|nr:nickel pincer cofactor biosynthesis protein LarC [Deltaproteobacteria bacterium]
MKTAFLDCFSGISGDMFLGALLDGGLPLRDLKACFQSLPLSGYDVETRREARNRIFGTQVLIHVHEGAHQHRGIQEIQAIIAEGDLSDFVKTKSLEIFHMLARVEGEIHGIPPEAVHFHEVGAVDSILDIVGTVYGTERLGLDRIHVSPLPLGSGFTMSAHGTIPLPAPATVALLKGVPVRDAGIEHETVTPTGAALVKGLVQTFGPMPPMTVETVGYGVGSKDLADRPNLVRILIGEARGKGDTDTVIVLETNLDDVSPEWLGFLMDRLFDAGALDVVFCPIQMKKNRPGMQLQVIGRPDQKDLLTGLIMDETATLGIRFYYTQRAVLKRAVAEVDSPWGKIRVKKIFSRDGTSFFTPEYEACRSIALKHGIPLRRVVQWVTAQNGPSLT